MFLRSAYDYYGWEKSYYQPDHNPNITVNNESACSEVLSYDDWADRLENIQSLFRLTKKFVFRCYFVKNNENCLDVDGFINYVSLIYCTFGQGGIQSIKYHIF